MAELKTEIPTENKEKSEQWAKLAKEDPEAMAELVHWSMLEIAKFSLNAKFLVNTSTLVGTIFVAANARAEMSNSGYDQETALIKNIMRKIKNPESRFVLTMHFLQVQYAEQKYKNNSEFIEKNKILFQDIKKLKPKVDANNFDFILSRYPEIEKCFTEFCRIPQQTKFGRIFDKVFIRSK